VIFHISFIIILAFLVSICKQTYLVSFLTSSVREENLLANHRNTISSLLGLADCPGDLNRVIGLGWSYRVK
jgi:hypothetical protein